MIHMCAINLAIVTIGDHILYRFATTFFLLVAAAGATNAHIPAVLVVAGYIIANGGAQ